MFGFPEATHKIYKHNFLRKIEIKFLFSRIELKDKESLVKEHISPLFPDFQLKKNINLIFDIENKNNIIENKGVTEEQVYFIFKKDKSLLQLTEDSFVLKINGSEYQSLESIIAITENIIKLAPLLGINTFERINFNKLNILELKEVEELSDLSYYAHQKYINTEIRKPNQSQLVINDYRTLTMTNSDEKALLILKYGINSPTNERGKLNHIFIEIDITSKDVHTTETLSTLKEVNKEMFNIFNWTVSNELINLITFLALWYELAALPPNINVVGCTLKSGSLSIL